MWQSHNCYFRAISHENACVRYANGEVVDDEHGDVDD
jgi:hypothetical protein